MRAGAGRPPARGVRDVRRGAPRLVALILLVAALPACGGGAHGSTPAVDAQVLAREMREGCVATNLATMLAVAQRLAPLCEVRSVEELLARAGGACELHAGASLVLDCADVEVGGVPVALHAELAYRAADGTPVEDPGRAERMELRFEAVAPDATTEGRIECRTDPGAGIVLSGTVTTRFADGCEVVSDFGDVGALRMSDPGGDLLVYTAGSVAILVEDTPGARGSAALVGRRAVVALDLAGTATLGEIPLG